MADTPTGRRFDAVSALHYVTETEAPAYRAVIEVFALARRRYRVQLRPSDVIAALAREGLLPALTEEQVHARLEKLREWGNLAASHDAGAVEKLDDFYRKRLVYRLTPVGEAAHEAVTAVERAVESTGALQTTMLTKIREALVTLQRLAGVAEPDPEETKATLDALHAAFDSLTTEASRFMGELQRYLGEEQLDPESFQLRKTALVAYLQTFVERLTALADPIRRSIRAIHASALSRLLDAASRSGDLPPAMGETSPVAQYREDQRERWNGIVRWFAPDGEDSVERELLRIANQSVSQLVHALHRLRDRVARRVDRTADFRQLARWFEACRDDGEAHALFARAFGLHGARHFHLADEDPDLATPKTSWWDAPPVAVPVHLRRRAASPKGGRTGRLPDFTGARDWLRARRQLEEERRDRAVRAFGRSAGPRALSELGRLDRESFEVFLELLDAALAGDREPDGTRTGETEDGRYRVTLRPIAGAGPVQIETSEGRLTAPQDAELEVEVNR